MSRLYYRSSAAVSPIKYECDSKNMTDTFARSKSLFMEKLTIRTVVPRPPPQVHASEYGNSNTFRRITQARIHCLCPQANATECGYCIYMDFGTRFSNWYIRDFVRFAFLCVCVCVGGWVCACVRVRHFATHLVTRWLKHQGFREICHLVTAT